MVTEPQRSNFEAYEERRKNGMQLLTQGVAQADVARQLRVSQKTVSRWAKAACEGEQAWRCKRIGRPPLLDAEKMARIRTMLQVAATAHGFPSPAWTQQRIVELIRREFNVDYRKERVWSLVRTLGLM